jgi:hypothetical protein
VWLGVDDGDLGLTRAELLGQPERGVEADVSCADHEDPLGFHRSIILYARTRKALGCPLVTDDNL